jgi:uncharacterized damage-inducible protein DinB
MVNASALIKAIQRNQWVIQAQTEGLDHAASVQQLPFRGNCMNWVVGHIAAHRDRMSAALNLEPALDSIQTARYARGSAPVTDAADSVRLEQMLETLAQQTDRLTSALAAVTPEVLDAVYDAERGDTVGDRVEFLIWHETYHVGQLEMLRQLAGTDDAII